MIILCQVIPGWCAYIIKFHRQVSIFTLLNGCIVHITNGYAQ